MEEFCMSVFCDKVGDTKDSTCKKSPGNPSTIELNLLNDHVVFKILVWSRTDLLDFHRMVVAEIKIYFKRLKTSVMNYRD